MKCPFCAEEIHQEAIKCKHCGTNLTEASASRRPADYGLLLLAAPVAAAVLSLFWVGGMNLFQSPQSTLGMIVVATVLGTATIAALEASKLGMRTDREKGTYSPTAWFFIITFMWVIGYPAYLLKRKQHGLPNLLGVGVAAMLVFLASSGGMNAAIESKKEEIRANLERIQTEAAERQREFREMQAKMQAEQQERMERLQLDAQEMQEQAQRNLDRMRANLSRRSR